MKIRCELHKLSMRLHTSSEAHSHSPNTIPEKVAYLPNFGVSLMKQTRKICRLPSQTNSLKTCVFGKTIYIQIFIRTKKTGRSSIKALPQKTYIFPILLHYSADLFILNNLHFPKNSHYSSVRLKPPHKCYFQVIPMFFSGDF